MKISKIKWICYFLWTSGVIFVFISFGSFQLTFSEEKENAEKIIQAIQTFRKEKDHFFKTAPNSPLEEFDKLRFRGLRYFPIDLRYRFEGKIERYIININDPKYYAIFPTNKGPRKRYIRYGKFRFTIDGKEHTLELYKSIGSDIIFIPFYDKTNGKETYEGGRYLDAEVLMPGYRIVVDFNYAYNPSCVYNEKFVCVLPLEENRLKIEIPVGEKKFK
ncbi:MAG: DUF1684 domain-containing protein [Thermodesulfobacteriota bacterium]